MSAAEQAHDAASLRLSSIREHRTALEAKLKEAQEAAAAAAKDEEAARTEVWLCVSVLSASVYVCVYVRVCVCARAHKDVCMHALLVGRIQSDFVRPRSS